MESIKCSHVKNATTILGVMKHVSPSGDQMDDSDFGSCQDRTVPNVNFVEEGYCVGLLFGSCGQPLSSSQRNLIFQHTTTFWTTYAVNFVGPVWGWFLSVPT